MKPVFKSKEYSIFLRRDGRHAVVNPEGQPILGEEKIAVLLQHELIKVTAAAPQPEPEADAEAEGEADGESEPAETE